MLSKNDTPGETTTRDDKFQALNQTAETIDDNGEDKPTSKMFGFLRVRDIGVTKTNVLTMLLLEYCGMLALQWWSVYNVFYLQNQLGVAKKDLLAVAAVTGTIMVSGTFFLNIALGIIYDVFGRRTPILFFLCVSCLAFAACPFLTSVNELYILAVLLTPLPIIISNPFIPDLIHEESHGMGNMMRSNMINLASLSAYCLLLLNATTLPIFDSTVIFSTCTIMLIVTAGMVRIGMKDVIKEGTGGLTESKSQKVTTKYVLKQAFNLLISEPIILIGIFGSVIQVLTKFVGGTTTTLALQHFFTKDCAKADKTCDADGQNTAKQYASSLHITIVIISIPIMILCARLTDKYDSAKLLIVTDTIVVLSGFFMTQYTQEAASWQFLLGYLVSQVLDATNFVFTQTMLMSKLKPQSRGVIFGFNGICFSIGIISFFQTQKKVQSWYGEDFGKGGEVIYTIFFSILAGYLVILTLYVVFRSQEPAKKDEDESLVKAVNEL